MTNIGDGFKNIFLAGIGAMAYTGEKGKEIIDQLVEKGEITLEQGKELNAELQRKAGETASGLREGALEARMRMMTPEERDEFAAAVQKIASKQNAAAATIEVEVEAGAEADAVVGEDAVDAEPVGQPAEDAGSEDADD